MRINAMWVICCGMIRSGSTLQYNIVKELVESTPNGKAIGWWDEVNPHDYTDEKKTYVVKTHNYSEEIKNFLSDKEHKLIFIYRDVRDVIVSLMVKNQKSFKQVFNQYFIDLFKTNFYNWMQQQNLYYSKYEEVIAELGKEIQQLSSFLEIPVTPQEVNRLQKQFTLKKRSPQNGQSNPETNQYKKIGRDLVDQQTLIHANHIYKGEVNQWKSHLNKIQIAYVEYFFNDWLKKNGYRPAYTPISQSISYYYYRLLQKTNSY